MNRRTMIARNVWIGFISFIGFIGFFSFPISSYAEDEARTIDAIVGFCHEHPKKAVKVVRKHHRHAYCKPRKKIHKHHHHRKIKTKPKVVHKMEICHPCESKIVMQFVSPKQYSFQCFRKFLRSKDYATDPLPPCFRVFVNKDGIALLHPEPEFEEKVIPTINLFLRNPGCYVACYSRNPDKSALPITNSIYLIGQIRVRGNYVGKQCIPENFEDKDIRSEPIFKELCSRSFSCIGNSCWAVGNTGSWFGL